MRHPSVISLNFFKLLIIIVFQSSVVVVVVHAFFSKCPTTSRIVISHDHSNHEHNHPRAAGWGTRNPTSLFSTPEEQARFIEYQVQESTSSTTTNRDNTGAAATTTIATASTTTASIPDGSATSSSTATIDRHQQHLQHQQAVFDSMSEWFANREQEVTPELEPIYQKMASDMLTQMMASMTTTKATKEGVDDTTIDTTAIRILDVACGTGVLWEFLLEQVKGRGAPKDRHDHERSPPTNFLLEIQGVDLSPAMVSYAKERAKQLLLSSTNSSTDSVQQQQQKQKHSIQVTPGDIVQYCQKQGSSSSYDGIVLNACFGNFHDPRQVLASLPGREPSSASSTTILISHPLGAKFVQELHNQDPKTVPHTLPESLLDMVLKWTFGLPGIVPTRLVQDNYYLMTLQQLDRATTLPLLQRYRGMVDKGYGRGGKKLGVPTANLPARLFQNALTQVGTGVYFGWATLEHLNDNKIFQAVVNVGYSPTFEGEENKEKIIEAHLINGQGLDDFYGKVMRLELSGYLRPEQKFDSFPALLAQIRADIKETQLALAGSPFVQLRNSCKFLGGKTSWIGSSGGDDCASWEFVDHRETLTELLNHNPALK